MHNKFYSRQNFCCVYDTPLFYFTGAHSLKHGQGRTSPISRKFSRHIAPNSGRVPNVLALKRLMHVKQYVIVNSWQNGSVYTVTLLLDTHILKFFPAKIMSCCWNFVKFCPPAENWISATDHKWCILHHKRQVYKLIYTNTYIFEGLVQILALAQYVSKLKKNTQP